jgi:hypothetical protein
MANRFDLEQQIMDCWKVTDDIELVYDTIMNSNMSNDQLANALLGMITMYNLKFNRCFATFEECVSKKDV